jgi:hypothetical protein
VIFFPELSFCSNFPEMNQYQTLDSVQNVSLDVRQETLENGGELPGLVFFSTVNSYLINSSFLE